MSGKGNASPSKLGKAKAQMAKDARQKVKERTEELLDDDDFGTDIDFDDDALLTKSSEEGKIHTSARRRLEDYLEERRLRRDLEDDFDF